MNTAEKLVAIAEKSQAELNAIREMNLELEGVIYDSINGGKSYYDAFWDAYQLDGQRTTYQNSFSCGWGASLFKPKHKIVLGATDYSGKSMFFWFGSSSEDPLDWRLVADKIDVSPCTNATGMFDSAKINYIDVDLSNCTTLYSCFNGNWQYTQRTHVMVKVSAKCTDYTAAFSDACITHLFFADGSEIAANVSFNRLSLVKDSITNIFQHLSTTTTGKTVTFKTSALTAAFGELTTSQEWLALVDSRPNWTISLA